LKEVELRTKQSTAWRSIAETNPRSEENDDKWKPKTKYPTQANVATINPIPMTIC
jgi:hypothetical protein